MMIYIYLFFTTIIIYAINNLLIKKNFLSSQTGEKHQTFVEKKNIVLSGGIYLGFFTSIIFFLSDYKMFGIFILFFLFLGLFVDAKIITKPYIRFFLQLFLVIGITYFYDLQIISTRVPLFDYFLKYKLLNYIFVCFCILVLVNGTNFIDGLNGLVTSYYLIVLFFLYKNNFLTDIFYQDFSIMIFFYILLLLFFFNIFNKLYLGDSGSYLLSIIFSFVIINYYYLESSISPYYIILLLWYPCFENLFSILRKFKFKKSPIKPDNNHLHQLLFYFIKKKINLGNLLTNNCCSLIINIFNFSIFFIGSIDIFNTQLQIYLIALNIFIYLFVYFFLLNFTYKNK
jgi:UDP-N-acetylmuramyl pentapeptide phosphotransferase/UDP-N-acetylglucosamine-1-phosphate transferase